MYETQNKWIRDLNINPDTLNFIVENVGNILECTGTEDNFLYNARNIDTERNNK